MLKIKHGQKATFQFKGFSRQKCVISIDRDSVFICQNNMKGGKPKEMFGFKFGYYIGSLNSYTLLTLIRYFGIQLQDHNSPSIFMD